MSDDQTTRAARPARTAMRRLFRAGEAEATADGGRGMGDAALHPLQFEPILKRLIWGGRRLGTVLNKPIGHHADYAESWEVADHRDSISVVAGGPWAGTSLRHLVHARGAELLGPRFADAGQFPLLVKFLDAHQVLSVQVHPDDDAARRLVDDNGKTEAWVVVHAEPGSVIYAGLRPGVDRGGFAAALARRDVEPLLHRFPAEAGQCILIPAGTVHAIGAGVVLVEVQQMSDATFRLHDWGRVGPDGKPRALHLDEALEATDFRAGPVAPARSHAEPIAGGTRERLARCDYFALERLRLAGAATVGLPDRFTLLIGLGGSAAVHALDADPASGPLATFALGETVLLPACFGPCRVAPVDGAAVVLTCVVP